jgi:iron complex outermembrane receptor protein
MTTPRKNRLSAALLAALIAAPLVANAQVPEDSTDATDAADAMQGEDPSTGSATPVGAQELEAVTVSARRRDESLQDVPVAVSAFELEDLRDMQARNLDGLQGAVPNLNIVQGRGSSSSVNAFIRGIGQPDALQTFDPGVGIYVDDVYFSRIQGGLFSLYDVERIEVLRGPQGTLYGKNSTGGAIKVVTRRPGDQPVADVEFTAGNYGRLEGRFYGSMPFSDTVGASIAFVTADNDGYVTDPLTGADYNEDDNRSIRFKLAGDPSEHFSWDLAVDYTKQDNALALGRPTAPLIQTDLATGPVALLLPDTGEYDFESSTSFGPGQGQELEHTGFRLGFDVGLSDAWTFKSITAYRELETASFIDIDASQFELGDVLVAFDQDQTSQEFQFHHDNGGTMQSVLGLYYLKENVPSHQEAYADDLFALGGAPISFLRTIDDDLSTTSYAAFAHTAWEFAPTWSLSAGLRYTREKKDYQRSTSTFWGAPFGGLNETVALDTDQTWDAWTPSLSLEKNFNDNMLGYVSANRGFKSGGFNGRANSVVEAANAEFAPEYVWTYEAGLKMTSDDRRLLGNVAVFHSQYKDFQARVSDIVNPDEPTPTFSFPVLNAAELTINGVEFEGIALVGDATKLSAQLGWMDAKYDEFVDPRVDLNPALGNLHDHVPFSPDWTARIGATHSFYFANGGAFTIGGDVSYRGETWLSVDNRDALSQDAYTLLGVYGVYDSPDSKWQVRAGVRNATDEVYKVDGQEFSSVGNIQTAYYGWPRNYYASVRYSFF